MEACGAIYAEASDPEFWEAEAALASLERLKAGVTTAVVLLGGGDNILRTDDPLYGELHIRAVRRTGVREVVCVGPCRPPFPRTFRDWRGGAPVDTPVSFERQMEVSSELLRVIRDAPDRTIRGAVVFPVHDPELVPPYSAYIELIREQAQAARELSREADVPFVQDGHRAGTIALAEREFGLLGADCLFAHCVDLTEDDIDLLALRDVKVAHNPSAIMSIRGRCPAPELIERGVTVALGSDASAPDRSYDPFRHMAQAMHYHRRHFRSETVLPAGKALEMVTIDAARAISWDDEIGSLDVGKQADITVVDLFKPHLAPVDMPVFRLAHYANAADVDTVLVAGKILMENRRVLTVTEREILETAEATYRAALTRSGLAECAKTPPDVFGRSGLS
jgi:cytosine/adenosine deaminase-related metal-dependent hydrolase